MSEETTLNLVDEEPSVPDTSQTTETPQEPQYTELERRAMEQGWKPLDQWDGDPAEHRSAREFLDRGELLGALKITKKQVQELTNTVRFLTEHQRKVHQAAYEQALKDLRKQKVAALEAGDAAAVVELEEQIDQHREAIQTIKKAPTAPQPDTSPIFEDWLSKNQWYAKDKSKKMWADAMAVDYASSKAQQGERVTEQELYDYLHKEARRVFPEDFRAAPTRQAPPSPDGAGRQAGGKAKVSNEPARTPEQRLKELTADMPEAERREVEKMVRSGWVTAEQFVKDFELVKNRGR